MIKNGIHPVVLLVVYVAIALAPVGLAAWQGLPPRPFWDELATALAMVGFSMLLVEFVLSGRFRWVSGRIGIDITMRFHQVIARGLTLFILAHPFLYSLPMAGPHPGDPTGQSTLELAGAAFATGGLAWLLLPILVAISIFRRDIPYRYETWRLMHGIGAVLIALLTLHHALGTGRYSSDSVLAGFWVLMVVLALLTVLHAYLIGPLRQLRHPYRVASLERVALKTWELVIEPVRKSAFEFKPGQFVWLTLGRSPFAITEHPFSICSCPADRPRVGFMIKEAGDFTSRIGTMSVGDAAYIDGPHGHLILPERHDAGVTFIAGGVGLAPVISILRDLRAKRDTRPVQLIYGNRIADQITYASELEDMKNGLDMEIHYVLSEPPAGWSGRAGVIGESLLREIIGTEAGDRRLYVVCGPTPMIDSVAENLSRLGIPMSRVLTEKFSYD